MLAQEDLTDADAVLKGERGAQFGGPVNFGSVRHEIVEDDQHIGGDLAADTAAVDGVVERCACRPYEAEIPAVIVPPCEGGGSNACPGNNLKSQEMREHE